MEKDELKNHCDLDKILKCVRKDDNFLITTHINPDGDCIASVLVFAHILKHFGKKYQIVLDDEVPKKFDFIPSVQEIKQIAVQNLQIHTNVLVVLDSSSLQRIGKVQKFFQSDIPIINIDHHTSNKQFGHLNLIRDKESSTVEIVYSLLSSLNVPVSPEISTLVYTGIICDTGRFLFQNTTHRSLLVCSEMMRYGALPYQIAKSLYYRISPQTIKALVAALSTIEIYCNGRVACMYLENGFMSKEHAVDTEGFVDFLMSIEGTEVEFFMFEKKPKLFRVSFRSKNHIDVNRIAQSLGGGGHKKASGCIVTGTVDNVRKKILAAIKNQME